MMEVGRRQRSPHECEEDGCLRARRCQVFRTRSEAAASPSRTTPRKASASSRRADQAWRCLRSWPAGGGKTSSTWRVRRAGRIAETRWRGRRWKGRPRGIVADRRGKAVRRALHDRHWPSRETRRGVAGDGSRWRVEDGIEVVVRGHLEKAGATGSLTDWRQGPTRANRSRRRHAATIAEGLSPGKSRKLPQALAIAAVLTRLVLVGPAGDNTSPPWSSRRPSKAQSSSPPFQPWEAGRW